ncbi:pyridoxine kinase [Kaistia soli DSM 19436]|uniref:pyridoxal kinase n=1 Tax=Kaistia soli DSM 19436 TaxID=1122133 RepID=A0A1M5CDF0_9HYPH|nr:pyridoxal kinase [Kaistia soli]SHF52627.1 pyridoxine kinase [Kaistia soli DSM 19436]
MPISPKPAVLVLTSEVVRGAVGGRAAGFTLERLGFPLWTVHTVTLPWHPGHGRASRIVPDEASFAALIDDLLRAPWLGEIGGILTGYVGAATQPAAIARLIDAIRRTNPDVLYLCDPVMGDNGALYVPEANAAAIRDYLVPRADILTPNLTELAFLAGQPIATRDEAVDAARALTAPRVAVTSALSGGGETETLLVTADAVLSARHALFDGRVPNGTGDLFAGLMLARLLDGADDSAALGQSTATLVDLLSAARSLGADELPLATLQERLVTPEARVTVRTDAAVVP